MGFKIFSVTIFVVTIIAASSRIGIIVDASSTSNTDPHHRRQTSDHGGSLLQQALIDLGGHYFHHGKNEVQGRDATLIAKGTSYLTYFKLAICSAVLYLEPWASNDAVMHSHIISQAQNRYNKTSSIALEISYHKPVRASDFRWATSHFTQKNGHTSPSIQDLIHNFNELYKDVKRGDRYLVEFDPESNGGVSLSLNGILLGSVGKGSPHEKELANAIYSIWFGDQPFFERLKSDLLTPINNY
eukprot:CAMPEP_0171437944 /NCGR_PEP_ID=MMETSP0881-20121228/17165_1 /TAXON_ID=67004 /ORGANISM="Thalassiosira weissflogii, Strain CCMP1336" /LENGTH=242 /DNA_ID=CAMNT_0011959687 /DNA_START=54 /DNA_END=779 /DNA_ORIENTATION=-